MGMESTRVPSQSKIAPVIAMDAYLSVVGETAARRASALPRFVRPMVKLTLGADNVAQAPGFGYS